MRVLFLLLAFAGALVFSTVTDAAPPGKGHLGAPTTSTDIIAAVPANWPPQYSLDEDGNPTGFAIDVLNHLAKELNLTVRYKVAPNFVEAIQLLEAGEADLIPNSGIVSERKSNNLFTPSRRNLPDRGLYPRGGCCSNPDQCIAPEEGWRGGAECWIVSSARPQGRRA